MPTVPCLTSMLLLQGGHKSPDSWRPESAGSVDHDSLPLRCHWGDDTDEALCDEALGYLEDAWLAQVDGAGFVEPLPDDDGLLDLLGIVRRSRSALPVEHLRDLRVERGGTAQPDQHPAASARELIRQIQVPMWDATHFLDDLMDDSTKAKIKEMDARDDLCGRQCTRERTQRRQNF